MKHDLHGAQKKLWRIINIKRLVNKYNIKISSSIPDQWKVHLKNLYKATSEVCIEGPFQDTYEKKLIYNFHFTGYKLQKTI